MLICLVSQFLEDVILISSDSPSFQYDLINSNKGRWNYIAFVVLLAMFQAYKIVSKDRITF